MSLACNAWAGLTPNTLRNAMQSADCQKAPANPSYPLPPDNFRVAVVAGLQQIAAQGGVTVNIGAIDPADLEAAAYNLNCAIEGGQLRFPDLDHDKYDALIIYLLNQILCAGV